MHEMRQAERGLAGRGGQDHAARAKEAIFGQIVVDQKRQHEQWPQQRLMIALAACERRIATDARIGVIDRRDALPVDRWRREVPRLVTSAASMTRCVAIGK